MRLIAHIVVGSLLAVVTAEAGDRSNMRGTGMARTFNASSRGIEALGINPANLAIPDRTMRFAIGPFGMKIGTELFSYHTYMTYFTGRDSVGDKGQITRVARELTEQDKNDILDDMPQNPSTRFDLELQILAFTFQHPVVGALGFSVTEKVGFENKFSRDYFRMVYFGLLEQGSVYNFDGVAISGWWLREFNFSYAFKVPWTPPFARDLYAGFSYKLVNGYGVMETVHYRSSFGNYIDGNQYPLKGNFDFLVRRSGAEFFNDRSETDFNPLPEPAGKGTGIDFGLSSEIMPGLRTAFSITDMGSITWDKNVREVYGLGEITITSPFTESGSDSLNRAIEGDQRPGETFSTPLPTALRFGATIESDNFAFLSFLPGNMFLALDYTQGLNNSLGNTTSPRFSLGMEYRIIPLIPLRTGIAIGGSDKFRWAAGFGIDLYLLSIDVGMENFGLFFTPKDFQMFQLSAGVQFKI